MKNETKQTAVEWLYKETMGITLQLANKRISHRNWELQMVKLHEQAKEMEKEQMIDFALECQEMFKHQILEKFNETYGGNK